MSLAADTTSSDGERKFTKCDNTLSVGHKLLKLKKAIQFFQGKAELIDPKVAPIITGEDEVSPIVVPQVDDAQPAVVRAEQMEGRREAEKKLEDRIAKKLDVCVLFKTYSDSSFRDLVETKPLVKRAFNTGDIPVVVELWKEWFLNGTIAAAAGIYTAKEVDEAAKAFNKMSQHRNESVLEYQTRFKELKKIATTIGQQTYTELALALKIIMGLRHTNYKAKQDKMLKEEDRQGKLAKEGIARENLRGHPQSEEKAWALALDWERDLPAEKDIFHKRTRNQRTDSDSEEYDSDNSRDQNSDNDEASSENSDTDDNEEYSAEESQDDNSDSEETSSEDSESDTEETSSVEAKSEDKSKNQGVGTRERLNHVESTLSTVLKARSESDNTESLYDPDISLQVRKGVANALDKIFPRIEQLVSRHTLISKSVGKLTKDEKKQIDTIIGRDKRKALYSAGYIMSKAEDECDK